MQAIYGFYWDCGGQGYVEGYFVADSTEIAKALGEGVNLGEVLGKHSDIYGELEDADLKMVSKDENDIEVFQRLFPDGMGYNPLDYI